MKLRNIEFKVKVKDLRGPEKKLLELNPVFKGEDHQVDTYFNVPEGRLKLREGRIENALIYYKRPDIPGIKQSDIVLYKNEPDKSLIEVLTAALGIRVVVDKLRKIYFIDNVKFHFDTVKNLGYFIEVEAIDETGQTGIDTLTDQCLNYSEYFGIESSEYIEKSYSDMMV